MASNSRPLHSSFTDQATDLELLAALKSGDVSAFSLLYDRYVNLVYAIALRILGQPEEAEDITQEVLLRLWHQPDHYQPDRGSLSNYLAMVTRSKAIDRVRSRSSKLRVLQRVRTVLTPDVTASNLLES
ncbi:MAG: sigma-70 family RNA polymerase sigma factor, partial [Cyanobacteria bacterium P01_H01_bin.121]